jgi:hypothetical protein
MAGIDRSEYACESPEAQRGIPEETLECPSIVHSHMESPGVLSEYSATWPSFSVETRKMPGRGHSLENIGFRRMCHNEWRGVLLNVLVLACELFRAVKRASVITLSRSGHLPA